MKSVKNAFLLLLAALLISSTMTACGDTTTAETNAGDTTAADTVPAETEPEKLLPDLPDADYEGYTFTILTRGQFNSHWCSKDAYAEELSGEPINDAVYNRNLNVGEKYNFTIAEAIGDSEDPSSFVTKAVQAGDDIYDMLMIGGSASGNLATQKMLLPLDEMPHMDLEKPWYDQSANASLSIGHKL
ncbi:MAG: hypothetical protein IJB52_05110, partial [Clostridia bacterium]|nr:hypothetical protein [Clostridia bacterium]